MGGGGGGSRDTDDDWFNILSICLRDIIEQSTLLNFAASVTSHLSDSVLGLLATLHNLVTPDPSLHTSGFFHILSSVLQVYTTFFYIFIILVTEVSTTTRDAWQKKVLLVLYPKCNVLKKMSNKWRKPLWQRLIGQSLVQNNSKNVDNLFKNKTKIYQKIKPYIFDRNDLIFWSFKIIFTNLKC